MELPSEVLEIPPEVRERIRQAALACRLAGEEITVRSVRRRARAGNGHVTTVVRLVKAGALDPEGAWTDEPTEEAWKLQLGRALAEAVAAVPFPTEAEEVVWCLAPVVIFCRRRLEPRRRATALRLLAELRRELLAPGSAGPASVGGAP